MYVHTNTRIQYEHIFITLPKNIEKIVKQIIKNRSNKIKKNKKKNR